MDTHNDKYIDVTDRGPWMQTYTGKQFFPGDPRPEEIHLLDVAHALAHTCRYGGHVLSHYSVAQHSVILAEFARTKGMGVEVERLALMHDAAEAYIGDHIVSVKSLIPEIRVLEAKVWAAVCNRFRLTDDADAVRWVGTVDKRVCLNEKAVFMPGKHDWAINGLEPLPITPIAFMPAEYAKREFLYHAAQLGIKPHPYT